MGGVGGAVRFSSWFEARGLVWSWDWWTWADCRLFVVAVGLRLSLGELVGERGERGGEEEGWGLGLCNLVSDVAGEFLGAMVAEAPPALFPSRRGLRPKILLG